MSAESGREFARLMLENPRSTETDAYFYDAIKSISCGMRIRWATQYRPQP